MKNPETRKKSENSHACIGIEFSTSKISLKKWKANVIDLKIESPRCFAGKNVFRNMITFDLHNEISGHNHIYCT